MILSKIHIFRRIPKMLACLFFVSCVLLLPDPLVIGGDRGDKQPHEGDMLVLTAY